MADAFPNLFGPHRKGRDFVDKRFFGEFVLKKRRELGMTQEQLADKLFVTNKAVSKWENGQSFPDITMFEPLAESLGITVSELISCKGEERADESSVKDLLRLSADVIKRYRKRLVITFSVVGIIFVCLVGRSWKDLAETKNMDYLYWQGFYYTPENGPVPEELLSEPMGTVNKAGKININNHGGDSNCADPDSGIYYLETDKVYYEGTLVAEIDGSYRLFRIHLSSRQDYEKYNRCNVKGEIEGGMVYTGQIY